MELENENPEEYHKKEKELRLVFLVNQYNQWLTGFDVKWYGLSKVFVNVLEKTKKLKDVEKLQRFYLDWYKYSFRKFQRCLEAKKKIEKLEKELGFNKEYSTLIKEGLETYRDLFQNVDEIFEKEISKVERGL